MAMVNKSKCQFCSHGVLEMQGRIFDKNGKPHECKPLKRAKQSSGYRSGD